MNTNTVEQPDIKKNAISLIEAQDRIADWRNKIEDAFGTTTNTPVSVLIPYTDLRNIIDGFSTLPNHQYEITGARFYFTFSPEDGPLCIKGVMVPVGYELNDPNMTIQDIVIDVDTNEPIGNGPVDPKTNVSVYNFTHPCPPLGCEGVSSILIKK